MPISTITTLLGDGKIRDIHHTDNAEAYSLLFISQKWQGISWKHELIVFAPESVKQNGALLFITGGSVKEGMPSYK